MNEALHIVILAAGQGTRMKSKTPKVLHSVLSRPLIEYVVRLAQGVKSASLSVVVGPDHEKVIERVSKISSDIQFIVQNERLGTAHALMQCRAQLENKPGSLLVLSGDVILLKNETLKAFIQMHSKTDSACTVMSMIPDDPSGYGRIIKNTQGDFDRICEEKDCDLQTKRISEVNGGIYCFKIKEIFPALDKIKNTNAQKEYYLTDALSVIKSQTKPVGVFLLEDPIEALGINDRCQLSYAQSILQKRVNLSFMQNGVSIHNPENVFIDPFSEIDSDVEIESNVHIYNSKIAAGVYLESMVRISNSSVGKDSVVKQGCYLSESQVGSRCTLGPYAHLRPLSLVEDEVKLGNFVEVKKSHFKSGSKASHLSYIGDAEIGERSNLGCGFITCNYDGEKKYKTVIESDVFVGSDSQIVAPVSIGKGSYIASGTTVTEDVPSDALVISRGKQLTKPGYASKLRAKKRGS